MLLQINEPNTTTTTGIAVAIDFGTSNSLVAWVENGKAKTLSIDGSPMVPSIVYFADDSKTYVGKEALVQSKSNNSLLIKSVKRLFGKSKEEGKELFVSQKIVGKNKALIDLGYKIVDPEEVAAHILRFLVKAIEQHKNKNIQTLVITVPAYFDDLERNEVKQAAKLIGFSAVKLLNEPTAAAIAYGLEKKITGLVLIYDLGGGTFDVSILKLQQGVFAVQAVGGNTGLGGDDIDLLVLELMLEKYNISNKDVNIVMTGLTKTELTKYLAQAKSIKEQLTHKETATTKINQTTVAISIDEFDAKIAPLIDKSIIICQNTLRDANVDATKIDEIVLVGGSSRTKLIERKLIKVFGKKPICSINPDEVVAIGAAIHAHELQTQEKDLLLLDVTPLSLGLETMGGLMDVLIPRNSSLPIAKRQEFTTYKNNQTAMIIKIFQGERSEVAHNRFLGEFIINGIPPMVAGSAKIAVDFSLNADGLLEVSAKELSTNKTNSITIQPAQGLEDDAVIEMLTQSKQNFAADIEKRMLIEACFNAKQIIEMLTMAMENNAELLDTAYKKELVDSMNGLIQLVDGDKQSAVGINDAVDKLDKLASDFMQVQMDKAVQNALGGTSIDFA